MLPAASELARQADRIFFGMTALLVMLLVGITGAMVFFVIRYRRDRNPVPEDIRSNLALEIAWTIVPTVLVLGMFYSGLVGFAGMRGAPADATRIGVAARMWSWTFEYGNGRREGELRIPVGRAVRLDLRSEDVLHSFFVPAFRIKEDAVPGTPTYVWFRPERVGTYDIFCAEYCGLGHSRMLSKVHVVEQAAFDAWYEGEKETEAPSGRDLLAAKGCTGCHSLDGSRTVGPTLKDVFGRHEVVVTNGAEREIVVDRVYLRRSILDPGADLVKGYPPVMPPQGDLLSDEELAEIIRYLATPSGVEPPGGTEQAAEPPEPEHEPAMEKTPPVETPELERKPAGTDILAEKGCTACHSLDGPRIVGPTFKGIFGKRETVVTDGTEREITVDRDYLRTSLLEPQADVVKGYPPVMPPQGAVLTTGEIEEILEALEGMKAAE